MKISRLLSGWTLRQIGELRHPTLFKITAALFVLTLLVPDPLPFIDELILGLLTLLFSRWQEAGKRASSKSTVYDNPPIRVIPSGATRKNH